MLPGSSLGVHGAVRVAANVMYFTGRGTDDVPTLFRTDGTAAGTRAVANAPDGYDNFTVYQNTLYFGGYNDGNAAGWGLWRIDPATGRAQLVKDVPDSAEYPSMSNFSVVGSKLLFSGYDPAKGFELWASDGTAAGTAMVKDLLPGTAGSSPRSITDVGGVGYFVAADDGRANSLENASLWRTDGTADSTVRVRCVSRRDGPTPLFLLDVVGVLCYTDGERLWRSDGTTTGPVQVMQLSPAGDYTYALFMRFAGPPAVAVGDTL